MVAWSKTYLADFQMTNVVERERPVVDPEMARWRPPVKGFYKINMDASIDVVNHGIEVSLVIRNHQGAASCS